MSTLTKVFALLVSALAIFLCGIVVTFIANTNHYKQAYEEQKTIAQAAQIQALAAETDRNDKLRDSQTIVNRVQSKIAEVQQIINNLSRQLTEQKQTSADKNREAQTAVQTVAALRQTIQNMFDAQLELQKAMDQDRQKMIAAQTHQIELTREVNTLRADNNQLDALRKRQIEKIYELEEENKSLRQKVGQVALAPSDFEPGGKVTLTTIDDAGIPIRGQITQIEGDKAAISVGSSSGVREGMSFYVTRGGKFLGNLKIIYVEPAESVGQLDNQQDAVVKGDSITTGFN